MDFFVSDTHFGHKNILEFERSAKFKSLQEHDNFIMSLIEKTVRKDDTLYHLGDFMFGYQEEILKRWKKLSCKKILILGNHDKYDKLAPYFDEVSRVPIFYADNIVLSHEPIPVSNYILNVHGHLHSSYLDSPNHLNVNIFMMDYKIPNIKYIESMTSQLPQRNETFLCEWYRDLYCFLSESDDRVINENGKIDVPATVKLLENKYMKKITINGDEIEVKKIAKKKGGECLYRTIDNKYYIGRWDEIDKIERIERCEVVEMSGPSRIAERWDVCWVNGVSISKVYPQEKDSVKYKFYHIERSIE